MQHLNIEIIRRARTKQRKDLEAQVREAFMGLSQGMNLCPLCNYTGKYSPKGSLKVFPDGSAMCFNCHKWGRTI